MVTHKVGTVGTDTESGWVGTQKVSSDKGVSVDTEGGYSDCVTYLFHSAPWPDDRPLPVAQGRRWPIERCLPVLD